MKNLMHSIGKPAAQGDVLIRPVSQIPNDAQAKTNTAEIIVGHSETGHHHVAVGEWLKWFQHPTDPLVSYLHVPAKADIVHRRDFHTHETIRLDAGDWEIRRQREWSPEGWRRVAD